MSDLWIPHSKPPLLDEKSSEELLGIMLSYGPVDLADLALEKFELDQPDLADYFDDLAGEVDPTDSEIIRMGGAIAFLGYRHTGYFTSVTSETLTLGHMLATIDGIPDTFVANSFNDARLVSVIDALCETPEFYSDTYDIRRTLTTGAGCTRFYLEQALADAA